MLETGDCLDSGSDLECRLGQRIQELGQRATSIREHARVQRQIDAPPEIGPTARATPEARVRHEPKVLLVGPELIANAQLREEIQRQGYRIATSHSEPEALMRLSGTSPDLVLSQYVLGRSDGASLVQAMQGLPGIERIPVVLLDEARHEGRRDAARAVGAAGYVALPRETQRFVTRLAQLIETPGRRRFTRYAGRFAARIQGTSQPCLVTEVGRGGVFVSTPSALSPHTAIGCDVSLPELARSVRFRGQVVYCAESQGETGHGLGLRFFEISPEDEAALIEYLAWLESRD